jgi:hypothetical protein
MSGNPLLDGVRDLEITVLEPDAQVPATAQFLDDFYTFADKPSTVERIWKDGAHAVVQLTFTAPMELGAGDTMRGSAAAGGAAGVNVRCSSSTGKSADLGAGDLGKSAGAYDVEMEGRARGGEAGSSIERKRVELCA